MVSIDECFEKLDLLEIYMRIRIDANRMHDYYFPTFEEAFNSRHDEARSLFIPHYCQSYSIHNNLLCKNAASGLGVIEDSIVYRLGNYYSNVFVPLSDWIINPDYKINPNSWI